MWNSGSGGRKGEERKQSGLLIGRKSSTNDRQQVWKSLGVILNGPRTENLFKNTTMDLLSCIGHGFLLLLLAPPLASRSVTGTATTARNTRLAQTALKVLSSAAGHPRETTLKSKEHPKSSGFSCTF